MTILDHSSPAAAARPATAGERLFARYAFAPNELGYCGPADSATLFELAVTGQAEADLAPIARRFSGSADSNACHAATARPLSCTFSV